MEDILTRFALLISGIFVIVDPVGTIPLMLGLTRENTKGENRAVIWRACLFGAGLLIFFAMFGGKALAMFRINLDAFRIAGGVLLFLTALEMLRGSQRRLGCQPEQKNPSGDISFVPLGMPSLAGPGAITSVIVFSTDHTDNHLVQAIILISAILLVFVASYLILRASLSAQRLLGQSGLTVLTRVMGLFLAALAIQFMLEGTSKILAGKF